MHMINFWMCFSFLIGHFGLWNIKKLCVEKQLSLNSLKLIRHKGDFFFKFSKSTNKHRLATVFYE
jgi:hypothetical protein